MRNTTSFLTLLLAFFAASAPAGEVKEKSKEVWHDTKKTTKKVVKTVKEAGRDVGHEFRDIFKGDGAEKNTKTAPAENK